MLGGFFTRYVFDKISENEHPTVNLTSCINNKQKKIKCTNCKEVCKKNVYEKSIKNANWDNCTNCNLCVSACPARSIGSSTSNLEEFLRVLDLPDNNIWINCKKSTLESSLQVECLAVLPWELIAYLVLSKNIFLDIEQCIDCKEEQCLQILQENLQRIVDMVGEKYFDEHVFLGKYDGGPSTQEYSRREIMGLLFKNSKKTALKLMPKFLEEEYSTGLLYRYILHKGMESIKEGKGDGDLTEFYWKVPAFTKKCWGCGICEKICPQDALKLVEADDGYTYIKIKPLKCNSCGLCDKLCYDDGIDGEQKIKVANLKNSTIASIKMNKCSECKRPIKNEIKNSICAGCRQQI